MEFCPKNIAVILQNPYKLKGKTAYLHWTNCEFGILYKYKIITNVTVRNKFYDN